MAELGISGYAQLMKQQKNPFERRMQTTAGVISSMPKDGGITGLEGIGKLPLLYALGRDQAQAEEFDQQQTGKEDTYLGNVLKMEQEKSIQDRKDKAMKNFFEMAKIDADAANQMIAKDPLLQETLSPGFRVKEKIDKDQWMTVEGFSADGQSKTTYQLNLQALGLARDKLKEQGVTGTPTLDQVADAMPPGFAFKMTGAAKAADNKEQTDKPQSQAVKDPSSPTGWSWLTEQGNMLQGAPDPTKAKEKISITTGNPDKDRRYEVTLRKEFEGAPIVKSFDTIRQQTSRMESVVNQLQDPKNRTKQNFIALDQSLIMVFNKMLDDMSAVREGEYARTIQNSPILSRVIGKMDQIRSGGAGFTNDERKAIITLGRDFYRDAKALYDNHSEEYKRIASETGADANRVVINRKGGGNRISGGGNTGGGGQPKTASDFFKKKKGL
ncbi:MAG: hypothetical protein FD174_2570 [Geobacteraceae bacterium]|nr:MAG: hypothetical protein FD174_2570 [Geobacteraceae bacterium]